MHRLRVTSFVFVLLLSLPVSGNAGEVDLAATLEQAGYVSVPVTRGPDRRLYVEGKIHGEVMNYLIDFSNEGALFDARRLKKMGIELTKTGHKIPTRRKTVQIKSAEILGLEFQGKSMPKTTILAGDVGAIYNTPPGKDGPDGALGTEFLKSLGGVLDFETMRLYLKLR
ncbi:MAG: hypothetical protein QF570_02335 [Myxococcota bacterium]|jgi:hypothetical protein|nr:hypothetical protein [Myxococcota bacterium]